MKFSVVVLLLLRFTSPVELNVSLAPPSGQSVQKWAVWFIFCFFQPSDISCFLSPHLLFVHLFVFSSSLLFSLLLSLLLLICLTSPSARLFSSNPVKLPPPYFPFVYLFFFSFSWSSLFPTPHWSLILCYPSSSNLTFSLHVQASSYLSCSTTLKHINSIFFFIWTRNLQSALTQNISIKCKHS